MKIIALGNRQRMGKNTVAEFMKEELLSQKKTVEVRGFADVLKDEAHRLFKHLGLHERRYYELYPEHRKTPLSNGMTARDIWIKYGNACRAIDPDIWIHKLFQSVTSEFVIIADLRFPNEALWVNGLGGELVSVVRPGVETFNDGADDQLSEDWWSLQIENSGTLCDLRHYSLEALRSIQRREGWR